MLLEGGGARRTGDSSLRHVVGVGDPADLVGVLLVVLCEVGGAPAVDWVAHILRGADEHGEEHQEDDRVAVMKAVHNIIVIANVHLGDLANSADQTVHHRDTKILPCQSLVDGGGINWCQSFSVVCKQR